MSHFSHSPNLNIGPNVVEASKIESIFLIAQPDDLVIEAVVKNGRYDTEVGVAVAAAGNTGDNSAISSGTYTDKNRSRTYTVKVTKSGALGVATIIWTTDKKDDEGVSIIIPASGTINIGTKGLQMTFNAGPGGMLNLNNTWLMAGKRNFVATAPFQHLIFRGVKSAQLAASVPDAMTTIFGVMAKKAYGAVGLELGWIGTVQALDEF